MHWCADETAALATVLGLAPMAWRLAKHWARLASAWLCRAAYRVCDNALLRILWGRQRITKCDAICDETFKP